MVCTEPLTRLVTPLTTGLSLCSVLGSVFTIIVNIPHAVASLTLTVNSGFALTAVNTVNNWCKSACFLKRAVNDDR